MTTLHVEFGEAQGKFTVGPRIVLRFILLVILE